MKQLMPSCDGLWNLCPPSLRQCVVFKVVWLEILNVALSFTVKMGFQSADAILTTSTRNDLNKKYDIRGIYTLLVSTIFYFVILKMMLMDFFWTGKLK